MHDHCCVPMCTNRRKKTPDLSFHLFPRKPETFRKWIVAIRRDEGQSFRVTANTVVCGAHFKDEDYFGGALATSSCGKDEKDRHEVPSRKRRLKPDAVPSIFSFRRAQSERPSPTVRRQVAQGRTEKLKLAKKLITFGPLTKPESVEKDLKEAQSDIADLRKVVESLRAENSLLQSQILRFMNIFKASNRLEFFTGLDSEQWTVVWAFLKPSRENVRSAKSAAKDEEGRQRKDSAGVKCTLSLEDQQ